MFVPGTTVALAPHVMLDGYRGRDADPAATFVQSAASVVSWAMIRSRARAMSSMSAEDIGARDSPLVAE